VPVRRDQFEIGLEREYALFATVGDTVAYLLACERLLATFHARIDEDAARRARWHAMQADGWRLAPEYAHCLVEIASPPFTRDGWAELLAGYALLEAWLDEAASLLGAQSRFDRVECTPAYSVRTDRFVSWDGAPVTAFPELLIDPAADNWLVGAASDVPACFAGTVPEILYAGFTSTNATVHPPISGAITESMAAYCWRVLYAARQIDRASPQRHAFLRDGRIAVPPDPDVSTRDALVRWGDPATASLLDALVPSLSPDDAAARFRDLFGQPPSPSFTPRGFHAYSCRPRVLEDTMLFELRCFHPGLPLANLGALLPDGQAGCAASRAAYP
jgi:hypothetical protein